MIRPPWSTRTPPSGTPYSLCPRRGVCVNHPQLRVRDVRPGDMHGGAPYDPQGDEALRSPPDTSSSVRRSGATDNILSIGSPQAIKVSNASSCRGSRRAITPVPVG